MRIARVIRLAGALLIAFVGCPALLAVHAPPAAACSCLAIDDDEAFSLADAVFTGSAVERREADDPMSPTTLVFDVDHVYKGDVARRQTVRTPSSSAACGVRPSRDQLLVFASEPGTTRSGSLDASAGELVAFLCGGTRDLSGASVPTSFGEGRAPPGARSDDEGGHSFAGILAITAGVALVGAVVAIAVGRRPATR
jgi:hypothetical protein